MCEQNTVSIHVIQVSSLVLEIDIGMLHLQAHLDDNIGVFPVTLGRTLYFEMNLSLDLIF